MNDTRKFVKQPIALDSFGVSLRTFKRWKKDWTPGAHYVVAPSGGHLYDPYMIAHWLTHSRSNPEIHRQEIERILGVEK